MLAGTKLGAYKWRRDGDECFALMLEPRRHTGGCHVFREWRRQGYLLDFGSSKCANVAMFNLGEED